MALSGSSRVAVTSHNTLVFSWAALQNITENRSQVSWTMELIADQQGGLSCEENARWEVVVGTVSKSGSSNISVQPGETILLASGTVNMDHQENGEKTFRYYFSQEFPLDFGGKPLGTLTGEGEAVLNTIFRPSQPTASLDAVDMGSPVTIVTNAMPGLTHTLEYHFGSVSGVIARGVTDAVVWIPPVSLAEQIPSAASGMAQILCKTYFGTTHLGTRELALSLVVPANVVPTLLLTAEDLTPGTMTFGDPVQNVSRLALTCDAFPAYGSPIVKTSLTLDGKRYAGGVLREAGSHTLVAEAVDSRGRVGMAARILTVLPYKQPSLRLRASRCREDGTADDVGGFAKITVTGNITPVSGKNHGQLVLQWGDDRETVALGEGEFQWERIVAASVEESMTLRAEAQDALLTAVRQMELSTGYATMDFLAGGKGISLGKMAHRAGFDCNMEAFFAGGVNGMRFGLFGETEVEGPALAGVSKGVYWGLFGMKVTAGGVEAVRLAGNLEAEFALVSGCPVAEGCSGWILGV